MSSWLGTCRNGRGCANARPRWYILGRDPEEAPIGVDHALKRFAIDSTRLGITGYSYCGVLTNWVITHSHRFAVATSGATVGPRRAGAVRQVSGYVPRRVDAAEHGASVPRRIEVVAAVPGGRPRPASN
ncbi:MAG: prolyl oligopeptidase family serine peptidase [Gemmatimonadetes bacterium]|nr:prolyl oligopeptidase family serine peptidase [Gemmatimonadota bacterium]